MEPILPIEMSMTLYKMIGCLISRYGVFHSHRCEPQMMRCLQVFANFINENNNNHQMLLNENVTKSLQTAAEVYNRVRCWESNTVQNIRPQMAIRLSALSADRALPAEIPSGTNFCQEAE